jgi:hypothetical protein
MSRDLRIRTEAGQRVAAGMVLAKGRVAAATLLGAVIGAVQVGLVLAFLAARRPDTSTGADRGFGSNPNLLVELGLVLGLLAVSVILVTIALAWLRVRWFALVMPVVLVLEWLVGSWVGSMFPADNDWRVCVVIGVLAAELAGCVLLLPRRGIPRGD